VRESAAPRSRAGMRWPLVIAGLVIVLIVGGTLVIVLRSPPPPSALGSWGWVPCAVDRDCEEGSICRVHYRPTYGPIRACRPIGPQREGERCGAPPETVDEACKASLNCNYGFCGVPCSLGSPASCPPGTVCRGKSEDPSCVPDCRERGCYAGERCVGIDEQLSICGVAEGDCDVTGCPAGQVCQRKLYSPGIRLRCIRPCPADKDCGADAKCEEGACLQRCDVSAPKCPPDWYCAGRDAEPTYCHPPF